MKGLRQMPFLRVVIPFILGILASLYFEVSYASFFYISLFLFGMLVLIWYRENLYKTRWLFGLVATLLFFCLGYFRTALHNDLNDKQHFSHHLQEGKVYVEGNISEMPILKNGKIKTTIEVTKIGYNQNQIHLTTGKLLAYINADSLSQNLQYGDKIFLHQYLRNITAPANPEAFNYKRYLYCQNIHYQVFIKEKDWERIGNSNIYSVYKPAFALRKKFISYLRKYLPDEQSFSVGSALILGYKDEMDSEVRAAYAETGAMHVLAVSGLHVGIIYLLLSFFFDKIFKVKSQHFKIIRGLVCLLGIWSFALLTGMSASVLRASTMFSVIIVGTMLSRFPNIYNSLAASAFLLLFINPYILMNVGFQLSYLAVLGIVYFQPKIAMLIICENKFIDFAWQLLCVSVAAQLATLPLSLYYFHQFPVYFWLSGLIVVPAASLILSGGLLIFLFESMITNGAWIFGKAVEMIIYVVNQSIFIIQSLPFSVIKGIWISLFFAFVLYSVIGFLINAINTKRGKSLVFGMGLFLLFFIGAAFQKSQVINNKQLIVYDVYKSTLIHLIDNNKLYQLKNKGLDDNKIGFASDNYIYSQFVNKSEVIHINKNKVEDKHLYFENNFLQFHNQKIYLLNEMPKVLGASIELNYLLIYGNPEIDFAALENSLSYEKAIIDNSNTRKNINKWIEYFEANNIDYHYTPKHGAWILEL